MKISNSKKTMPNSATLRKSKTRYFSLIEMLVVISIIATLAGLLLPSLGKSKVKAKFVRWLAFNRQCSNDPSCVLNLNFQQGEGVVKNSAVGGSFEGYDASKYDGELKGECEWTEGRWPGPSMKKAVRIPGRYSYIEIPADSHSSLGTFDSYTIVMWVRFDGSSKGPLLSKGLVELGPPNHFGQFYIYQRSWWDKSKTHCEARFEIQATGYAAEFSNDTYKGKKISFGKDEWIMLTLRKRSGKEENEVDLFVNDNKMVIETDELHAETIPIASTIWIGGSKHQKAGNGTIPYHSKSVFGLRATVDELIIYRRALPDSEIRGHYEMGNPY